MAKSKLIKDFVNSDISTEKALKNLIVILHNFKDTNFENWAKKELKGYDDDDDLPAYRRLRGSFSCNYIIGNSVRAMQYTNAPFPLTALTEEQIDALLTVALYQSVSSLERIVNQLSPVAKQIPHGCFPTIQTGTNAHIIDAKVSIDTSAIQDIIAKINEKILEIFMYLDDEFGNLDDLDIDLDSKSSTEITSIKNNLYIMLFDNGISIGDNNTISNSSIRNNDAEVAPEKKGLLKKLLTK